MDDYKDDDGDNQIKKQFNYEPKDLLYKTIVANNPIELDLNGLFSENISIISQIFLKLLDILHDGGNIEDLPSGIIHQIFELRTLNIDNIQLYVFDIFSFLSSTGDINVCSQITEEYIDYFLETIEAPETPLLLLSALEVLQKITYKKPHTAELLNGNVLIDHAFSVLSYGIDQIEPELSDRIISTTYSIISNCLLCFPIDKPFFDLYVERIKEVINSGNVLAEQLDGIISICKTHSDYAAEEFDGIEFLQSISLLADDENWKLTNKLFDVVISVANINPRSAIQIISTDFFSNIIPDSNWSDESIRKHLAVIRIAIELFKTAPEEEKATAEYRHAQENLNEYAPILISMYLENMYNCQYNLCLPITSIICNLLNLGQRLIIHQVVTSQEALIPHICSMAGCGNRDLVYEIVCALGSLLEFGDGLSVDFGQKNIYLQYINTEEIGECIESIQEEYCDDIAIIKRIERIQTRLDAMLEFEEIDASNEELKMEVFL